MGGFLQVIYRIGVVGDRRLNLGTYQVKVIKTGWVKFGSFPQGWRLSGQNCVNNAKKFALGRFWVIFQIFQES